MPEKFKPRYLRSHLLLSIPPLPHSADESQRGGSTKQWWIWASNGLGNGSRIPIGFYNILHTISYNVKEDSIPTLGWSLKSSKYGQIESETCTKMVHSSNSSQQNSRRISRRHGLHPGMIAISLPQHNRWHMATPRNRNCSAPWDFPRNRTLIWTPAVPSYGRNPPPSASALHASDIRFSSIVWWWIDGECYRKPCVFLHLQVQGGADSLPLKPIRNQLFLPA